MIAAVAPVLQPRILVLDDDPFQLVMQSRMLLGLGFDHVVTSDSAEAALSDMRRDADRFDVVVCDLKMPGMDGIEFLQALNTSGFRGRVILISGEGTRVMHTVQDLLGRAGVTILGTLEKPAPPEAMHALLTRWTPTARAAPPIPVPLFSAADVELAAREQQWMLHYQPKVDLRTGDMMGVEALVRWNHPQLGLVFPDRFIGIAEDCGAIDPLTDWVLHESIRQLASWRGQGLRLRMAVNVSMENLRAADFAGRLSAIAREADVPSEHVTLEITESRLMSRTSVPLETLARLRLQRFNLSIDDFGTGHSSLAQLRDVPFTELKVDRGFVRGARFDPIIRPILEGSVGIAKRMGMVSVAEGVETEEDWHLLREIGCDLAQGYFIGRPMAAERMPAWLDAWKDRRDALVAP